MILTKKKKANSENITDGVCTVLSNSVLQWLSQLDDNPVLEVVFLY